jgi:hypothetical protein
VGGPLAGSEAWWGLSLLGRVGCLEWPAVVVLLAAPHSDQSAQAFYWVAYNMVALLINLLRSFAGLWRRLSSSGYIWGIWGATYSYEGSPAPWGWGGSWQGRACWAFPFLIPLPQRQRRRLVLRAFAKTAKSNPSLKLKK